MRASRRWIGASVAGALIGIMVLLPAASTVAQTEKGATPARQLMTYFYKDPRPQRLIGFLDDYASKAPAERWDPYPPVAGFLAFVFRSNPDWVDRLIPVQLDAKGAATVAAALRLAGKTEMLQRLRSRLQAVGFDRRLVHEFTGLPPRLEDLRIASPTHLDILWGASFASGEERFVRMIIDYFAQTANRSEPMALDVAQTALAMAGGPKDVYEKLRAKYDEPQRRAILYAAVALWALQSNAKQHAFVGQAISRYVDERTGSYAAKALSVFMAKQRKT